MTLEIGDKAGEETHSLSLVSGLGDTGNATHRDRGKTSLGKKGMVMVCEGWWVMSSVLDILKYFTYVNKCWLNTLEKNERETIFWTLKKSQDWNGKCY